MVISFTDLPPPLHFSRSIFIHTLVTLIGHKTNTNDEESCLKRLYGVKYKFPSPDVPNAPIITEDAIQSSSIKFMILGLNTTQFWRTLNQDQMRAVAHHFEFTQAESILLYASLIAMSPQKTLLDFSLAPRDAWNVACLVGDRAIEWLQDDGSFMRRAGSNETLIIDAIDQALIPAITAYNNGLELV